jgi:hypothetical protein
MEYEVASYGFPRLFLIRMNGILMNAGSSTEIKMFSTFFGFLEEEKNN